MADEDETVNDDTKAVDENQDKDIADQFYDDRDEDGNVIPKEEENKGDEDTGDTDSDAESEEEADDAADDKADEGNEDDKDDNKDGDKPTELAAPKDSLLDKADVQRVQEYATEKKLSKEDAQNVLDITNKAVAEYAERYEAGAEERNQTIVTDATDGWLKDTKADKEIGGDNLKESAANANRVIEQYGTPELKAALNESGLGNHPELVRLLSRIGKAGADDTYNHNNLPPEQEVKSNADLFYQETHT